MKTWEMIKILLENPNLKFRRVKKRSDGSDLIVELKNNEDVKFLSMNQDKHYLLGMCQDNLFAEWELVKESVDFITAIKAFAEGKKIRSVVPSGDFNEGAKYQLKECDKDTFWVGFVYDTTGSGITVKEILEAKWFIED